VIPNGIDTTLFKPMERRDERVIGFVGELREKKGLTTLLRAYTQIHKSYPTTLLIVSDVRAGEDRKIFDELHSSIPNAKIILTGYVSNHDLPSYYSVVDVLVHPSLQDGLPHALLEAIACEKAVIATHVGGVLDVLRDCENGRIVAVNDVKSFTTVMQEIMSDKDLQKHLGWSAPHSVESKFTLQSEWNGNLLLYRNLGLRV